MPTLLADGPWKKMPQLRVVPVNKAIPVRREILAHEKAEEMVRGQKRFLVAPCICRRERTLVGQGCGKLEEACLIMGGGVDYWEQNGLGRVIDRDEALALLKRADAEGLVLQPSNAKKISNICMCCGCCCGVLRTIKKHPRPAEFVSSPFRAALDPAACSDCGVCLTRCPMEALTRDDGGVLRFRSRPLHRLRAVRLDLSGRQPDARTEAGGGAAGRACDVPSDLRRNGPRPEEAEGAVC